MNNLANQGLFEIQQRLSPLVVQTASGHVDAVAPGSCGALNEHFDFDLVGLKHGAVEEA
jgi:hypothetical protein